MNCEMTTNKGGDGRPPWAPQNYIQVHEFADYIRTPAYLFLSLAAWLPATNIGAFFRIRTGTFPLEPPPIFSLPRFILRIFQLSAKGAGRWFPVKQMRYTETTRGVHRVTLETWSGVHSGDGALLVSKAPTGAEPPTPPGKKNSPLPLWQKPEYTSGTRSGASIYFLLNSSALFSQKFYFRRFQMLLSINLKYEKKIVLGIGIKTN